jgi:hypothetical protein
MICDTLQGLPLVSNTELLNSTQNLCFIFTVRVTFNLLPSELFPLVTP